MGWFRIAQKFPRRLRWPLTDRGLTRMAWAPSYRAPHPSELLDPAPFTPPGPPPMPAEERALLDAVLVDPGADEPRLRYAEWLARRGDPRGEFIRQQIEAFHRGGRGDKAGENQERVQTSVFLSAPAAVDAFLHWLTPWSAEDVVFRRGFPEAMSLSGRAFISIGDGLFQTAPVRDVRLVGVAPFMAELAHTANLSRLERLDLWGNQIGPGGVRELARSPHLTRLRGLDLSRNGLGAEGVRELRAAVWAGGLSALALAGNGLTADDLRTLPAGLTDLDVSDNSIGPALADVLPPGVRRLIADSIDLGPDGAAALAAASIRPGVLDLGFNHLGDDGVRTLAGSPVLAECRELVLRGNRIGPAGVEALARSPRLGALARLDLSANHLDDDSIRVLRERFGPVVLLR